MNPFVVSGYSTGKYFCNREKELKRLKEASLNRRNITLISLRRMGKSNLINYSFEKLKKDSDCLFIDIFPARSLNEFVSLFANSIYNYFGKSFKQHVEDLTDLIRSLGATLSFNPVNGQPEIDFGFNKISKSEKNLSELINFLEKQKKRVLIAFDEFQQILQFEEKNAEATLRANFQNVKNINFIYSGSNKGMMESIFSSHSKPFYQSTEILYLNEINRSEYKTFIQRHFKEGKIKINEQQINMILDICRDHTYYVQYFCNRLYSVNFNGDNSVLIKILEEILTENEPVYMNYQNLLTKMQWRLIRAIALEGEVKEPTGNKFLSKYQLGSASSVQRSLASLVKNEFVVFYKEHLIVSDVFFFNWLKIN